jgi:hypothetical protein
MANEMLESERRLLATDRGLKPGVDHRDHEAHLAAVAHKGSAQLKEVRHTVNQNLGGMVRVLLDKVGK